MDEAYTKRLRASRSLIIELQPASLWTLITTAWLTCVISPLSKASSFNGNRFQSRLWTESSVLLPLSTGPPVGVAVVHCSP
ncbi:MAG: hypothetical protein L7U62_08140, partial [Candidatus Poseidoniaceae archaeon]|nr:hypothetical protein [Candidatus Poseidoniaceae archaeon]